MTTLNIADLTEEQLAAALKQKKQQREAENAGATKEYHKKREHFCKSVAKEFHKLHAELSILKNGTCQVAQELYDQMYILDGKEPKPSKSYTIKNQDDTIKIVIDRQDRLEFTDKAIVHINEIRDIFKEKFGSRNKAMYSILDGLLIKNSKNEYDPKLLAKARRQVRELGDENLIAEFDKLDECQHVTGTSQYCRAYFRDDDGKWKDISLQFSAL